MDRIVRLTNDGSSTIYIPEMDENYHSGHGAFQEAMHVFIHNGLEALISRDKIRVFEMGFGTGLNALLALEWAETHGKHVEYTGIEAYPVAWEMAQDLNYTDFVLQETKVFFSSMHQAKWGHVIELTPRFIFEKVHEKIQYFTIEKRKVDCIFFDAFGPRAQSEMWEYAILEKMTDLLDLGGCLVTYCAKGQLKRDLKGLGLEVEVLPGPPGKREMTRAWKK